MFVFWGFVCECPTARYPIPPGEVRVLRGTGRQQGSRWLRSGRNRRALLFPHKSRRQRTGDRARGGKRRKKQRIIRFKQGKDVEKGFSSPYVHPFPLRRPLMEAKQL